MALKLNVPSIACDGCAETITESITTMEPDAKIQVDGTGTDGANPSASSE